MNGNRFSLIYLIFLVRKWFKPVLWACGAAIVISAIVALLLPVKYKSTAIFYATSSKTSDPEWIFAGEEKIEIDLSTMDIDRMMTVAESRELAQAMIFEHGLLNDYGFDTTNNPMGMQYALEEFNSNFTATHNARDAIEISFMHHDSKKAAVIANSIVKKIDELNSNLTRANRRKVLALHQNRFRTIATEFDMLRDSLQQTRQRYNLLNEDRQSQQLSTQVAKAEAQLKEAQGQLEVYSKHQSANSPKLIELKAQISGQQAVLNGLKNSQSGNVLNLEDYTKSVDKVNELAERVENMVLYYNKAKALYQDAKVAMESDVSSVYVVQEATPAAKKASPIRWLIVVGTTLATFFCCLVLISLYEMYRAETQKVMA